MPSVVFVDQAVRAKQLAAFTCTTAGTPYQPWASDANAAAAPVTGVLVQNDYGNAPGAYLETGGPGITYGNGIQIGVGQSDLINAPNAAAVWVIASVNGAVVRGQVR